MKDPLKDIFFRKDPALDIIVKFIEKQKTNPGRIIECYTSHPQFSLEDLLEERFPFHHYLKTSKDIYVKNFLDDTVKKFPQLASKFIPPPYTFFKWRRDSINRFDVYDASRFAKSNKPSQINSSQTTPIPLTHYGSIIKVNNLNVIIECSLNKFPDRKKAGQLAKKYHIFKGDIGHTPGYILIIPEENLDSSNVGYFMHHNVYIARFIISKKQFEKEIKNAIKQYKLNLSQSRDYNQTYQAYTKL